MWKTCGLAKLFAPTVSQSDCVGAAVSMSHERTLVED